VTNGASADRWATFDCYGTLIDWNGGIRSTLARLWPGADADALLADYHRIEPEVEHGEAIAYREVMRRCLVRIAAERDLPLATADEGALGDSLPSWPPFPEVPAVLAELRRRGWRLAALSNTDPDLLASSIEAMGVPFVMTVTAADAGSYKPAHGHWRTFRERAMPDPLRHVHVAQSAFHDIAPCAELGITSVWVNRLGESSDLPRAATVADLAELPDTLDRLVRA
jgi:2-haloacid dehalogenase